ncbi:MAG: hypothetical protein ACJ735_12355 [Actinomycetes bacterium]
MSGSPTAHAARTARLLRLVTASALFTVLVAVVFFVWTTVRGDRDLRDGDRHVGSVVGLRQPQSWNFFDGGRIVVTYADRGHPKRATIWLDNEVSDYHVGDPVTVITHDGRVRTDREANDPVQLGFGVAVMALVALIAAIGSALGLAGLRHLAARRAVWLRRDQNARDLGLRRFALSRRPPSMVIVDKNLEVRLPAYFGDQPIVVPTRSIAVVRLDDTLGTGALDDDAELFEEPIALPSFPTTWTFLEPNILVVLDHPVRVPPLRRLAAYNTHLDLPFTRGDTLSPQGATIDGMGLRTRDPARAVHELQQAGAEVAADEIAWLRTRRQVVADPAVRGRVWASETSASTWRRWAHRITAVAVALVVSLRVAGTHAPSWLLALPLVLFGLSVLVGWRASRILTAMDELPPRQS